MARTTLRAATYVVVEAVEVKCVGQSDVFSRIKRVPAGETVWPMADRSVDALRS
jgi:hypothetical protein